MSQVGSIGVDVGELAAKRLTVSLKLTGARAFSLRARAFAILLRIVGTVSPVPVVVELVEHEART